MTVQAGKKIFFSKMDQQYSRDLEAIEDMSNGMRLTKSSDWRTGAKIYLISTPFLAAAGASAFLRKALAGHVYPLFGPGVILVEPGTWERGKEIAREKLMQIGRTPERREKPTWRSYCQ
jgi:hypothetical protein